MNNSKNRVGKSILHFKRWSNKSYAIFNSIGKLVHIGFLARITQKLITVKSFFFHGLLTILHGMSEQEDDKNTFIGKDETELLLTTSQFNTSIAITDSSRREKSSGGLNGYILIDKIQKAFLGSFLFSSRNLALILSGCDFDFKIQLKLFK